MSMSACPRLPLAKNRLFQSNDLDEARTFVAKKFCDHRLDRMSRLDRFDAVHNRVEGQATSLNFIRYGADVEIEPGELGSFYLVQIPITGTARIDNTTGEIETGPGLGSVLNPHRHTRMRWREGCAQLLLQIDAHYLIQIGERLIGRPLAEPVRLQTAIDQRQPHVGRWVHKLQTCFSLAEKDALYANGNLHTQVLVEEQIIEEFLLCQPSNISGLLADAALGPIENRHVRRAMSYIRSHFSEPLTIGDIAQVLHVTPRSVQLGFKAEIGMTPMQYLRETRLREARHMLITAPSKCRIADICEDVGFGHLGRFSVEYKLRYGESPHETRQKHGNSGQK